MPTCASSPGSCLPTACGRGWRSRTQAPILLVIFSSASIRQFVPMPDQRVNNQEPQYMTPAVRALVALYAGVAFLQVTVIGPADVTAWLGFDPVHWTRSWWTLVTYALVPLGLWPLAVNVFALLVF